MRKRTYDVDLNKVVEKTFKFLRNHDVPKHWSKTKNERYDVHLMIVLYLLFCMADRSYKRFKRSLFCNRMDSMHRAYNLRNFAYDLSFQKLCYRFLFDVCIFSGHFCAPIPAVFLLRQSAFR